MPGLDDNSTIGTEWDELSPHRTIRPEAAPGARDPLDGLELPLLDPEALRIGATLGEGGMGVVKVAVQAALGREVAVKLLRPEHDGVEARRKLLHEAWVTGQLEHPNVVPVYEIGQDDDGRPYLVLKRIEGEPWSQLIGDPARVRERFGAADPLEWHLRVLLQVCNAVSFAHSRGVVHRDLKPDNVMLGAYGEVYVLDWGVAVALDGAKVDRIPRASEQRGVVGTPAYLAPEQLEGGPLSERTDLYLLGGLLYQVLHGRPPHHVEGATGPSGVRAILARVRAADPEVDPAHPADLRAILTRALARRPEDRFPSVEAFRAELQRWLDGRGIALLLAGAEADRAALARLAQGGEADPIEVLARLGACRFAYRRVLEADPSRAEAQAGLDEALVITARWYLGRGDQAAAGLLLQEASAAPAELVAGVDEARRQAEADRERLRRVDDERSGVRTRVFVMVVSTLLWLGGLVLQTLLGVQDHLTLVVDGLILTAIGAGIALWANDSLSKSALNRRVQATIVMAPALIPVGYAGLWALGIPTEQGHVLLVLAWASMALAYTVGVDRRLWPAPLAFFVAYAVGAVEPWISPWATFIAVAVVGIAIARIGWPELMRAVRTDFEDMGSRE